MPHGILYRLNLLLRTSRLFTVRRFGFVLILPFYNPMLLFYLSDIEISHAISVFFFYPVPYGVICCTLLKSVRVHILQTELHTDLFALDISLGKQDNSLDKTDLMKQINRLKFANVLNRISQIDIKWCNQQFFQLFIVILEKDFYGLAIVFFCVKLPV